MKVKAPLMGSLAGMRDRARELEGLGYDAAFSAEVAHDPFFPLLLAADGTERLELMTAIAVAFARNPMSLANLAHDLNDHSKGRFTLGLGSQIKPHITRRLSMPWSRPASRMREFILAMRAIWDCWYRGTPLDFRGEFYTHTLMTPMFTPQNVQYGAPRVMLAAVGPRMTEVAAEVADGVIAHAFTTRRYFDEVTLPATLRGLDRAGRDRSSFEIACPVFVVSGLDAPARAASRQAIRQQIAFYGSTPAYRPVLDLHGWGDVQSELLRMSKRGQWVEMAELIDDEILEEFAIVAPPEEVAQRIGERWGGALDAWLCTLDLQDAEAQRELVMQVRNAS